MEIALLLTVIECVGMVYLAYKFGGVRKEMQDELNW